MYQFFFFFWGGGRVFKFTWPPPGQKPMHATAVVGAELGQGGSVRAGKALLSRQDWRTEFGAGWLIAACTADVCRSAREVLLVEGSTRGESVGTPESRWEMDGRKRDWRVSTWSEGQSQKLQLHRIRTGGLGGRR